MQRLHCILALLAAPVFALAQPTFHTILKLKAGQSLYQPPTEVAGAVYGTDDSGVFVVHQSGGPMEHLGVPGGDGPLLPASGGGFYTTQSEAQGVPLGAVYLISPPAAGSTGWTQSAVYSFTGGADGQYPEANLVQGADGSLYGSTNTGGQYGKGTVFQLIPPVTAGDAWTLSVVYTFAGSPGDAFGPATLVLASDGSLFGAALGGSGACYSGFTCGLVFHLTPPAISGGAWQETILYEFQNNADGWTPGNLVLLSNGTIYGADATGGLGKSDGAGLIFSLTPPLSPGGTWTKSDIFEFRQHKGVTPTGLVLAPDGNLYGTDYGGGNACAGFVNGCGTVFELVPPASSGSPWTEKTIHSFSGTDGAKPVGLTLGDDGILYGATQQGAGKTGATVFRIVP